MLELSVAIGMAGIFAGLGVGLQAEAQALQQAPDQLLTGDETPLGQSRGQMALALAHPQQGRFRIAADERLHQLLQGIQKPRLGLGRRLATATVAADPRAEHHRARAQVRQATADRAARNPARPRHRHHPAVPGRARFTGRKQSPPPLAQDRRKRLEAGLDGSGVDHPARIDDPVPKSRRIPDSFVAFSPHSRFFYSDSVARAQALTIPSCV